MVSNENGFLEKIIKFGDQLLNDDFISDCEKSLLSGEQYNLDSSIEKIPNHEGIYLFQIRRSPHSSSNANFLDEFSDVWYKRESKLIVGNYPKSNVIDPHDYDEKLEWLPLYLGITENLRKRIKEHVSYKEDRTALGKSGTWALKLKRSQTLNKYEFQYSFIEFKGLGGKYFHCGILELLLREKIKPIIGA